jgi:hypothetical protein
MRARQPQLSVNEVIENANQQIKDVQLLLVTQQSSASLAAAEASQVMTAYCLQSFISSFDIRCNVTQRWEQEREAMLAELRVLRSSIGTAPPSPTTESSSPSTPTTPSVNTSMTPDMILAMQGLHQRIATVIFVVTRTRCLSFTLLFNVLCCPHE